MAGYLLDTNHLSAAIRPVSRLRERIEEARRRGVRIGTCVPALCELEVGIAMLRQQEAYRRALHRLLGRVRLWPIDQEVAGLYGMIFQELRRQGRVLSQVDMMLAAMPRLMNVTLLTSDRDFEALPDVHTENWLDQTEKGA